MNLNQHRALPAAGIIFAAMAIAACGNSASSVNAASTSAAVAPLASSAAPAPVAPASPSAQSGELSASCQLDDGGQPVTAQDYDGSPGYEVAVTNDAGSPVTVNGFAVTFSAFGGLVDNESPTVDTTLMEPGERWTYTLGFENAPQVSENTTLNETCSVTEVDTDNGAVTPTVINEPDGQQNTQQQEQQQAQASAAAANQQQEQNAQVDVATLTQDANFSSDVGQVGSAVTQTDSDLGQTRSDAANGNGDECINASTTVYNDAATTVYNDVLTTAYNDVNTVASDIATVRGDITTIQSDQAALQSSGLPETPGAAAAVSAAKSAIASAISTINGDIQHENDDLDTAYQIADSVGTGACAGDGPGSPPAGLSPIS